MIEPRGWPAVAVADGPKIAWDTLLIGAAAGIVLMCG